jgi:hypothetical protein
MTAEASLAVVIFAAAGARFGLPARQVIAMRPGTDAETGYITIEALLGLPHEAATATTSRLLMLRMGDGQVTVLVPGEVVMRDLPSQAIHRLPDLVAARSRVNGIAALALDEAGLLTLVNPVPPSP